MNLNKINGNTYYIDGPSNIGIFAYKNKFCMLIDTGIGSSHAKRVDKILTDNNLHPKFIINTHAHGDHCGGNEYFKKNYTGIQVYTSEQEKIFMENRSLAYAILSGGAPFRKITKNDKNKKVDFITDYGTNKIGDEKFEIFKGWGHTPEHIVLLTPNRVCFLGDSIFSDETIDKYSFPYLYNIGDSLQTLDSLRDIDADFFVIAHSTRIYEKHQMDALIDKNIANIKKYKEQILELLDQPVSKEDLLQNIIILNELDMAHQDYFLNLSTVSSYLSYLLDNNYINYSLEDGKVFYYKE